MARRSVFRTLASSLLAAVAALTVPFSAHAATQAFTLANASTATFPATTVGQSSTAQTIALTSTRGVVVTSIAISQTVNSHPEFTVGTATNCASVAAGTTCSIPVTFKPFYTGARTATLTLTDSTGAVYSVGLQGQGNGPQGLLSPGYNTYSGPVGSGYSGDGGPLSAAKFYTLMGTTTDAAGNIYLADYGLQNVRVVYKSGAALACLIELEEPTLFGLSAGATSCAGATSAPVAGDVYTIAGDATAVSGSPTSTSHTGGNVSNVLATTAGTLYGPEGIAVDTAGNVLISNYSNYSASVVYSGGDSMACLIEMANPTLFGLAAGATSCAGATSAPQIGFIYKLIGTPGTAGVAGDGGPLSGVTTGYGTAITVSPAGDIFFVSYSTQASRGTRIRVVYNGGAAAAKLIAAENGGTTPVVGYVYLLGGGAQTAVSSAGDNGLATASGAGILYPRGIALTTDGDVIFTEATSASAKVRVIYNGGSVMGKLIQTESASSAAPTVGYLYTLAGATAAPAAASTVSGALAYSNTLNAPYGVTTDPAGDIYYVDYGNYQLLKIDAINGKIVPYVGTGTKGTGNGNAISVAKYYLPWATNFGADGTVYVTDYGVYHINVDAAQTAPITFSSTAAVGGQSETEVVYHNNVGNQPLTISAITPDTNFAVVSSGSTLYSDCAAGTVLQPGATCAIGVVLSPTVSNQTLTGNLTVTDNSAVGTYTVALTGLSAVPTTTTVTSSSTNNASQGGSSVTFTATVAIPTGATVPATAPALSGTFTFLDGTTTLASGVAVDPTTLTGSYTTAALANGSHSISAKFVPGTPDYSTSTGKLTQVVTSVPVTTTLASSNASSNVTDNVTFTATVAVTSGATVPSGAPALGGTVAFTDTVGTATTTLSGSPVTVDATGVAMISTSTLSVGTHTITATFTPSSVYFAPSTTTVSQVVVAVPTTTTLTSSVANANQNQNVTLTATVAVSAGAVVPSGASALAGTVTFSDTFGGKTTSLATATAINAAGVATFSSSTLAVGTHTITATFSPSSVFYVASTATFTQVVSSPAYSVPTAGYGVAVTTGSTAAVPFSVTSVGGYSGTVKASCGALPANMSCTFSPAAGVVFNGTNTTQTITLTLAATSSTAAMVSGRTGVELAGVALGTVALMLLARKRKRVPMMLALMLGLAAASTVTGCSSGTNNAARGTFNINVTFTDGTTAYTAPVTVSVVGNP